MSFRFSRLPPFIVVLAVLFLATCRSDPPGTVSYLDSAGVLHTISPDTTRVFAAVDPNPVLSLGGPDVTGPTQFFNIGGVYVGPDGNLWIADGGSGEVRIFRSDGTHWKTRGGMGEGPGEFRRPQILGGFRGDSVAVWDQGNPRLTLFDPFGELARTVRAQWGENPPPRAIDIFADGSILAKKPVALSAGSLHPGQVFGDTVSLVRVGLVDRTEETLGLAFGPLWVFTGTNQVPIPFTIHAPIGLRGGEIHLAVGPRFQIQVFQDARLTEEYGVDRSPREVTRKEVDAYRGLYEQYISDPAQLSEYLSTVDHPDRPSHLPSYDRLVVAGDGNVWAQIYTPDLSGLTWDVFSPGREWLGQVELPDGFSLSTVQDRRLVGVWRDELGVEHVRVFDIIHEGSQ